MLSELDADLVALQEVSARSGEAGDVDQTGHLAHVCGMQALRGPTLRSARGEIGNALLSRAPPERVARIDLTQPGCEPRGALDVTIPLAGSTLRVVATHLGLSWPERRAQAHRLIDALSEGRADCTLLAGDMNEWIPFRGAVRSFDAWFGASPALRTFPAWLPLLPLDRIWAHPREALEEVTCHASASARVASDHLPIRSVLRMPKASGDGRIRPRRRGRGGSR